MNEDLKPSVKTKTTPSVSLATNSAFWTPYKEALTSSSCAAYLRWPAASLQHLFCTCTVPLNKILAILLIASLVPHTRRGRAGTSGPDRHFHLSPTKITGF